MTTESRALIDLERKFWQALVDEDADAATDMLCEPALMVSAQGAMKFDHATYRKMAEQGSMILTNYELSDMDVVFPTDDTAILTYKVRQTMAPRNRKHDGVVETMTDTSTWIHMQDGWKCIMHTETPAEEKARH